MCKFKMKEYETIEIYMDGDIGSPVVRLWK